VSATGKRPPGVTRQQVLALKEQIEQTKRKIYSAKPPCRMAMGQYEEWKLNIDVTNQDLNMGKRCGPLKKTAILQKADETHKEAVRLETEKQDLEKQQAQLEESPKLTKERRR
jgi:hypothetical protein